MDELPRPAIASSLKLNHSQMNMTERQNPSSQAPDCTPSLTERLYKNAFPIENNQNNQNNQTETNTTQINETFLSTKFSERKKLNK